MSYEAVDARYLWASKRGMPYTGLGSIDPAEFRGIGLNVVGVDAISKQYADTSLS